LLGYIDILIADSDIAILSNFCFSFLKGDYSAIL